MSVDRMDLFFDIGTDMVVNLSLTAKAEVKQFSIVAYGQISDLRVVGSIPLEFDLIPQMGSSLVCHGHLLV